MRDGVRNPFLDEATRKSLTKRKKYRVEAVMRGMIDSPEVQHEMESWGVPASKLNMKPSTHLLPTFLFTIAPWRSNRAATRACPF